jgi:hypothetical protein
MQCVDFYPLTSVIIVLALSAVSSEGIRVPNLVISILYFMRFVAGLCFSNGIFDMTLSVILVITYLSHMANIIFAKPLDFSFLQTAGPFAVGVRHIKIGDKKLDASVYYPMDKQPSIGKEFTATLFKDPPEKSLPIIKESARILGGISLPDFIFKPYLSAKMPGFLNGKLSSIYAEGKEPISPLIFGHGLYGFNNFYQVLHYIMAAHGYLVIAVNFQDGSCLYNEDENG